MTLRRPSVVGRRLRPGRCKPVSLALFLSADEMLAKRDRELMAKGYARRSTVAPYIRKDGGISITVTWRKRTANMTLTDTLSITYREARG